MPNPNPIYTGKPFSLAHMRRVFAMSDPVKLAAMVSLMPGDYFYRAYEFNEPTLHTDWTAVRDSGNTATNFAYNAQRNGALQGVTSGTDDSSFALHYHGAIFDPADKPFIWFRWVAPAAVSGFAFETGFSDPKTDEALPACTALTALSSNETTPTIGNGVTDVGAVAMDTDLTLTTAALIGDGTTGAAVGQGILNGAGTVWTPTAGGIIDVFLGVEANKTRCWIWDSGAPVGVMREITNGPDSGVLVRPYIMMRTRNTTSKTINLLKAVVVAEENRTS